MAANVEDVLRKLHKLFAQSDYFDDSDDEIVVSQKAVFEILEELNYAVYGVLEEYEATQVKRSKALAQSEREGEKIVSDARKHAEDVYAASILFSDRMLSETRKIIEKNMSHIKEEYRLMENYLDSRVSTVIRNKSELHNHLKDMEDGELYIKIIEEQRRREDKEVRDLVAELESQGADTTYIGQKPDAPKESNMEDAKANIQAAIAEGRRIRAKANPQKAHAHLQSPPSSSIPVIEKASSPERPASTFDEMGIEYDQDVPKMDQPDIKVNAAHLEKVKKAIETAKAVEKKTEIKKPEPSVSIEEEKKIEREAQEIDRYFNSEEFHLEDDDYDHWNEDLEFPEDSEWKDNTGKEGRVEKEIGDHLKQRLQNIFAKPRKKS